MGAHGAAELYSITEDPLATTDISADHPDEIARLHEIFLQHLEQHEASESFRALWDRPGGAAGTWAVDYSD